MNEATETNGTHTHSSLDILDSPIGEVIGLSENEASILAGELTINKIRDLAESTFFTFCDEVVEACKNPVHKFRLIGVPADRVIKEWHNTEVKKLQHADVSVLEGVGDVTKEALNEVLGLHTISDMATWPPYRKAKRLYRKVLTEYDGNRVPPAEGLKAGMQKKEVATLQEKLINLGQKIDDPQGYFGRQTQDAVKVFQQQEGLDISGIADNATIASIDRSTNQKENELPPLEPVIYSKESAYALESLEFQSPLDLKLSNPEQYQKVQTIAVERFKAHINTALADAPGAIREKLEQVDITTTFDQQLDIEKALSAKVDEAILADVDDSQFARVKKRIHSLAQHAVPHNPIDTDLPLKDHPIIGDVIHQAKLYHMGEIAGLSDAAIKAIIPRIPNMYAFTDSALTDLVEKGVIRDQETKKLGIVRDVYRLLDQSIGATKHSLDNGLHEIQSARELAKYQAHDWQAILDGSEDSIPNDTSLEDYATLIAHRVEQRFPAYALQCRISSTSDDLLRDEIETPQKLINRYTGLDIESIVTADTPLETKLEALTHRISLLDQFHHDNPNVDTLAIDLSDDSEEIADLVLAFDDDKNTLVFNHLKARQRAYNIANTVPTTLQLMEAGYTSALQITQDTPSEFQEKTAFSDDQVRRIYDAAQALTLEISTRAFAYYDFTQGGFNLIAMANAPRDSDYLSKRKGYSQLFGNQAFCECKHCQSVLSPAAYYVDLMHTIEKKILKPTFGESIDSPIHLKRRRPDLWKLELTCENTHTLVPTLEIANEILENYIDGDTQVDANRKDVEQRVYKKLATPSSLNSLQQPFSLPLEKLKIYLKHFKLTRLDIAEILGSGDELKVRAALNLSREEYNLIVTPSSHPEFFINLFNISFHVSSGGRVSEFDSMPKFLRKLDVTREDLGLILKSWCIANDNYSIGIDTRKKDSSSAQADTEFAINFTIRQLDLIHRFTRLWKKTDLSVSELDFLLRHLNDENIRNLTKLAKALAIKYQLKLSIEQLCALISEIPNQKLGESKQSFLDRLFNLPPFGQPLDKLPADNKYFVYPLVEEISDRDNALQRLLAGLKMGEEGFIRLAKQLYKRSVFSASPGDHQFKFSLTRTNLSHLYRHALIINKLKLEVDTAFRLIDLSPLTENHLSNFAKIDLFLKFTKFYQQWKSHGYTLADIEVITGQGIQDLNHYPDPAGITNEIEKELLISTKTEFSDTIFAFIPGLTEVSSKKVVSENLINEERVGILDRVEGKENVYCLSSSFTEVESLNIPDSVMDDVLITTPETSYDELRQLAYDELIKYHRLVHITTSLAKKLNLSVGKTQALIHLTNRNEHGHNPLDPSYWANKPEARREQLQSLITKLLPIAKLFKHEIFTPDTIDFINLRRDDFQVESFESIGIESVQLFERYLATAKQFSSSDSGTLPNTEIENKTRFSLQNAISNLDQKALAFAGNCSEESVKSAINALRNNRSLATPNILAVNQILRCIDTCKLLGVGAETLRYMVSDEFAELALSSDTLVAAFRSKYENEKEWKEISDPFEDKIRALKRDALTNQIVNTKDPDIFRTKTDLFHHFLIDIEKGGCARTSRLVEAISSLQHYVQRVIMNVESNANISVKPGKTELEQDRFKSEWLWRKNYRVWEANRKVFLFPETYIEPELRDNKTPIFEDLESTLLQQEVNEQNVQDAYTQYIQEFDKVSKLKIAGAYHDAGQNTEVGDVLHLFGVTRSDPPEYYYRSVDNLHWSESNSRISTVWNAWRKIDVSIPVREVSPIVYKETLYVFWNEIKTTNKMEYKGGGSKFLGYRHDITTYYTTLRLDGAWSAKQKILGSENLTKITDDILNDENYGPALVTNPKHIAKMTPKYGALFHKEFEPIEEYSLKGVLWSRVYPDIENEKIYLYTAGLKKEGIVDVYQNYIGEIDRRSLGYPKFVLGRGRWYDKDSVFYQPSIASDFRISEYPYRTILLDNPAGKHANLLKNHFLPHFFAFPPELRLITLEKEHVISPINGSFLLHVIECGQENFILQQKGEKYLIKRINFAQNNLYFGNLKTAGVEKFLGILNQKSTHVLNDLPFDIDYEKSVIDIDRNGSHEHSYVAPYKTYFQELFFHVPFIIANHLHSQQKYAAAQKWYHYIFDPTAVPSSNNAKNNVWQYLEFHSLKRPKLRDALTDPQAVELYNRDPFNPHAIARVRPTAYQKSIVMKYIDNLLDWADALFSRFTMESVNEATMLYIMAADILGERPAQLGECKLGDPGRRDYEHIKPLLEKDSSEKNHEFLIELENVVANSPSGKKEYGEYSDNYYNSDFTDIGNGPLTVSFNATPINAAGDTSLRNMDPSRIKANNSSSNHYNNTETVVSYDAEQTESVYIKNTRYPGYDSGPIYSSKNLIPGNPDVGIDIIRQLGPIFCLPVNKELLAYWDRVEERLFNIRHCMDIKGVRRKLELFAPEIDPRLLVRAKALGLSIDDVLESSSGDLPPYRFEYLIEKSKSYAATVQNFGSALLNALEKKDAEELGKLRLIHEQNIQKLTSKIKDWENTIEVETLHTLEIQRKSQEYNIKYYESLIDEGLKVYESFQKASKLAALDASKASTAANLIGAISALKPQVGSPCAITWGGEQLSKSMSHIASVAGGVARIWDTASALAGQEASYQRREQGWKHQLELADYQLKETEKRIVVAEIRKDIAKRSKAIHEKSMEQTKEIFEFYGSKFSSLGMYTWLSKTLQGLYRDAYNSAYSMARIAEQAFYFERGYDSSVSIATGAWNSSKSGLLAGEKLYMSLQEMEKRFIETNYRSMELTQSISLREVAPLSLVELRTLGKCNFSIPELYFDLKYPGHYKRKIKAVRVSIPCIVGPYVNVGARLSLTKSKIRLSANVKDELKTVPLRRNLSIATSNAQSDSGVFEFNFKDERYMPFEGAGAVDSEWRLTLPQEFRQFDYETISDVILDISFTAEDGGEHFQEKVEIQSKETLNSISSSSLYQLFDLKADFPDEWGNYNHSTELDKSLKLKLRTSHFPYYASNYEITIHNSKLYNQDNLNNPNEIAIEIDTEFSVDKPDKNRFLIVRYSIGG